MLSYGNPLTLYSYAIRNDDARTIAQATQASS